MLQAPRIGIVVVLTAAVVAMAACNSSNPKAADAPSTGARDASATATGVDGTAAPDASSPTTPSTTALYGWGAHQPPSMQWPVELGTANTRMAPERRALLADQLTQAREAGLRIGTVAEAERLGFVKNWQRVQGRGFEYVNWGWWTDHLDLQRPTTLAFEGDQPDSRIVSVAYNVLRSHDDGPPNDLPLEVIPWHYHFDLCKAPDGAIVASGNPERCAQFGGKEHPELDNWMVDLWVIPGWENPWGLVSSMHPDLFDPPRAWFGEIPQHSH